MIHIIGASGYIGKKLQSFLKIHGIGNLKLYSDSSIEGYIKLNLLDFDISDINDFNKGDIVVLLAAVSSPDVCENNYQFARLVNVVGTRKLINECIKREVKVLFFSSDVVYGFNQGVNDENTHPNPHGNYAKMKVEIEEQFKNYSLFKVFRLSYVYSEEDKFATYLKKCSEENVIPEVFNGFNRNVVHIDDVLMCIMNIILDFNLVNNSVINICGCDLLSRVDLARIFFEDNSDKFKIIDVPNDMLKSRPNTIQTKSLYIEKLLGRKPRKITKI